MRPTNRKRAVAARRQRLAAVVCLALLQIYTAVAGLAMVALGPEAARQPSEPPQWPTVAGRPALAAVSGGTPPQASAVAAALDGHLSSPALGGRLAAMVVDPATGDAVFSQRAGVPATPASTTKIATAVAALASLGPDFRIDTRVVRDPSAGPDDPVVLVGGGDPNLATPEGADAGGYPEPAKLARLAKATARALTRAGVTETRVGYDASLFTGPDTGPGWGSNYVPEGSVAPVTALGVDGGRVDPDRRARVADPPQAAAEAFAELLERAGITVRGSVVPQRAPDGAEKLAAVRSPRLPALVEHMLSESDNNLAEALARQVAIQEGQPASFSGAAEAMHQVLNRLGAAEGIELFDGSGLSTRNRLTAAALTRLLALAASPAHPTLRPAVTGLPVGGFSGTLTYRYDGDEAAAGAGVVRAKTGTLNGVSSLAGMVSSDDGQLFVFAFVADDVPTGGTFGAEAALDRLAAALAQCCDP